MWIPRAALLGALLLPVAGCGHDPAHTQPGVATLHTGAASAVVSAPPADQRPILRPDMSDKEIAALQNAWAGCLADHGVPVMTPSDPDAVRKATVDLSLPQYAAARTACASKEPEDWRDVEARTDPQYADRLRAELQCLVDQGVKAELKGDPPAIVFTDDRQVTRALDLTPACERKAFGDAMKRFDAQ